MLRQNAGFPRPQGIRFPRLTFGATLSITSHCEGGGKLNRGYPRQPHATGRARCPPAFLPEPRKRWCDVQGWRGCGTVANCTQRAACAGLPQLLCQPAATYTRVPQLLRGRSCRAPEGATAVDSRPHVPCTRLPQLLCWTPENTHGAAIVARCAPRACTACAGLPQLPCSTPGNTHELLAVDRARTQRTRECRSCATAT